MNAKRRSKGITRIEALVLLVPILVLLGGLGGVWLRHAHIAEARTRSMNNVKQMVLATHGHEAVHRYLPPAWYQSIKWSDKPNDKIWQVDHVLQVPFWMNLLPHLEQDGIFELGTNINSTWGNPEFVVNRHVSPLNNGAYQKAVPFFVNPADPSGNVDGLMNAVGVLGYAVNISALPMVNEVFIRGVRLSPVHFAGQKRTLKSGFHNGTANTVILAEHYVQSYDSRFPSAAHTLRLNYWGFSNPWSGVFFDEHSLIQDRPNLNVADANRALDICVHAPRAEGIIVGMADGSARMLSATIDAYTWNTACDPYHDWMRSGDW